jgi:putative SOS response-associated peptidase YedK
MVTVIKGANGRLELEEMLWGMKPKWAIDTARYLINARSEGISEKKTFKRLLNQKIVVPAEGFYEWKSSGAPGPDLRFEKTPYYFYRSDGNPVLMAGLFEQSRDSETGEQIETFVILTTAANSMMSPYHDRMPVIVEPAQLPEWLLKETDNSLLERITATPPNETLTTYRVSNKVNSSRTDGHELIEEVREA